MLFIWGFSNETNPIKVNYAKAALIVMAIVLGMFFIFMGFWMSNFMRFWISYGMQG